MSYDTCLDIYFSRITGRLPDDSIQTTLSMYASIHVEPLLSNNTQDRLLKGEFLQSSKQTFLRPMFCSPDPLLFNEVCTCIFRFITRGEYLPVKRVPLSDLEPVDLVVLGFCRFCPSVNGDNDDDGGDGDGDRFDINYATIDEPIAMTAILMLCIDKQPFNAWLMGRWKEAKESQGYVYEDIILHRIYQALTNGCQLDSILDFKGELPSWASEPAELVAIQKTDLVFETTPVSWLTLPYACRCSTWYKTVLWFMGCLPSPICIPDNTMGPDLLCFVKVPSRTTPILLGFQVWSGRQKSLLSAARTLNPALYWMYNVGLLQLYLLFMLIFFSCSSEIRIPRYMIMLFHAQLTRSKVPWKCWVSILRRTVAMSAF
jgi:hypothetical protein